MYYLDVKVGFNNVPLIQSSIVFFGKGFAYSRLCVVSSFIVNPVCCDNIYMDYIAFRGVYFHPPPPVVMYVSSGFSSLKYEIK